MKPHAFTLSIPSPCSETWEEMTACSSGKFCAACQHEVVDFTSFSGAAIAHYFESITDENVCGRFYARQLQDKTFSCRPPLRVPYKAWFLAASVAALTIVSMDAKAQATQTGVHVFPTVKQTTPSVPSNVKSDTLIIRGEVRNTRHEEVINSTIVLWQGGEMLVGTVSDFEGKYELQIPRARLSDARLFLVCTYVDIKLELPIPQPTEKLLLEQNFTINTRSLPLHRVQSEYVVGRIKVHKKSKKIRR